MVLAIVLVDEVQVFFAVLLLENALPLQTQLKEASAVIVIAEW